MKSKTKQDTKKKPARKNYRIRNWREYNAALVQRGSLEVWLPADIGANWYAEPAHTRGAQPLYMDGAIETALMLREVFHLPLRATEGFIASIFKQSAIDLDVPDYSQLSKMLYSHKKYM